MVAFVSLRSKRRRLGKGFDEEDANKSGGNELLLISALPKRRCFSFSKFPRARIKDCESPRGFAEKSTLESDAGNMRSILAAERLLCDASSETSRGKGAEAYVTTGAKKLPASETFRCEWVESLENGAPNGNAVRALWDIFKETRFGRAKIFCGSEVKALRDKSKVVSALKEENDSGNVFNLLSWSYVESRSVLGRSTDWRQQQHTHIDKFE